VNTRISKFLIGSVVGMLLSFSSVSAQVIGTFDTSRGGNVNFRDSSIQSQLRQSIETSFPGASFQSTDTLTPAFLSNVDAIMISSIGSIFSTGPITPLSAEEQAALRAFADNGGTALLFIDGSNSSGGFDLAHESLLDPFELDATPSLNSSPLAVSVTDPTSNPITNGPFGDVTSLTYGFAGFFDNLGPHAQSLATFDTNGESALAFIPPDTLSPGSGQVVFFGDTSITFDGFLSDIVILNALAVSVPEPASIFTLISGGAIAMLMRRRRVPSLPMTEG